MEAVHGTLTAVDAAKAKWWSFAGAERHSRRLSTACGVGYGYMNEYRVARAWADARASKIWAGSNEIMKELIGRDLGFVIMVPQRDVTGRQSSSLRRRPVQAVIVSTARTPIGALQGSLKDFVLIS